MAQITPAITNIYTDTFISGQRLFYARFNTVGSIIHLKGMNERMAMDWINEKMQGRITLQPEFQSWSNKVMNDHSVYYVLDEPIILWAEYNEGVVIYYCEETAAAAAALRDELLQFQRDRQTIDIPTYSVVITGSFNSYHLHQLEFSKPKGDLLQHYNDDLPEVHEKICRQLRCINGTGLHLLHGAPGTGKSVYLRHLIAAVRNKSFIFLSPRLAGNIDSPDLLQLFLRESQSILIIEDAEELLLSRKSGRNSAISFLLNLTDGLLAESMSMQIICTFNTNIAQLDTALLRKGRLKTIYEFAPLEATKAQALAESITGHPQPAKAMTLADIYNMDAPDAVATTATAIGFAKVAGR